MRSAEEDGERKDYVLIFAALEGIANQIRDAPQEADDFAVVHDSASNGPILCGVVRVDASHSPT
jgi:hypothetical protein